MRRRKKNRLSYISRTAYKNKKGYKDQKILDYSNRYQRFTGKGSIYGYAANKCIYCKPGIRLDKISDSYDQRYSGISKGIDFYIVGRGITQSKNINETIQYYQKNL